MWISIITILLSNLNPFQPIVPTPPVAQQELLMSHRGAAGLAPENTLSAIDSALYYQAAFIEIDVQRTKDNVLILMHDKSINRTTNGEGKVKDLNWSSIKSLEAGSHFSNKFQKEKIPTLEEALMKVQSTQSTLVIEVKDPKEYPGIGEDIIQIIKKTNTKANSMIISFDVGFIKSIHPSHPDIALGCLYVKPPKVSAPELDFVQLVSVYWRMVPFCKKRIKKIKKKGISTWAWTVNSKKKMQKLYKQGVDGIVTDYPNYSN